MRSNCSWRSRVASSSSSGCTRSNAAGSASGQAGDPAAPVRCTAAATWTPCTAGGAAGRAVVACIRNWVGNYRAALCMAGCVQSNAHVTQRCAAARKPLHADRVQSEVCCGNIVQARACPDRQTGWARWAAGGQRICGSDLWSVAPERCADGPQHPHRLADTSQSFYMVSCWRAPARSHAGLLARERPDSSVPRKAQQGTSSGRAMRCKPTAKAADFLPSTDRRVVVADGVSCQRYWAQNYWAQRYWAATRQKSAWHCHWQTSGPSASACPYATVCGFNRT